MTYTLKGGLLHRPPERENNSSRTQHSLPVCTLAASIGEARTTLTIRGTKTTQALGATPLNQCQRKGGVIFAT